MGLFIGIDHYGRMDGKDLEGAVHDATRMQALFRDRFGFTDSVLLTNDAATRDGVRAAFDGLLSQADELQAQPGGLQIVLYYAGHGSRVRDQATPQEGKDEPDGFDETWVPADGTFEGEADIRDDDIQALVGGLVARGAHVLFISDSCHSGTVHRGASVHASRMIDRVNPGEGPRVPLLQCDAVGVQADGEAGVGVVDALPSGSFVALTACNDHQRAWEATDETGAPAGRFSLALQDALLATDAQVTNQQLFETVERAMRTTWPDGLQTPMLAASGGERSALFLHGEHPPLHASIIEGTVAGQRCQIGLGELHGLTVDGQVYFFEDVRSMVGEEAPVAVGRIVSLQPVHCTVELDDVEAQPHWIARPRALSNPAIRVYAAPGLAVAIESDEALCRFVGSPAQADVILCPLEGGDFGVYSTEAFPDGKESVAAEPLCRLDRAQVGAALSRIGGAMRMIALEHQANTLRATIDRVEHDGRGASGGSLELREGERFAIRLVNQGPVQMYAALFAVTLTGGVELVSPLPGEPEVVLERGQA
ncbi:MAG: caspase family protein, partial [Phycisphaerales bacterium]|nr:caspase family protein [Phycisphaerales bacterium]